MKISVVLPSELTSGVCETWRQLEESDPHLSSPFFTPEFTMLVSSVRDDVEIAIIEQGGNVTGVFPFQRYRKSLGIPVAGVLSDYQGVLCQPGFECDPRELVKGCQLSAWDFDHLISSQSCVAPFHQRHSVSPVIDLSRGYEVYAEEQRLAGSQLIGKCQNMMRRMQREVGPIQFVSHAADVETLWDVLALKSRQYVRSSKDDLFAREWVRSLMERIHATQTKAFAGMLSLLYAGGRLVAGHMGMRSLTVWHYWFPAYNMDFAKYSPGLLLLLKMVKCAEGLGLKMIDLGMGMSLYKERLMNTSISLAAGSVELPSVLSLRRSVRRRARGLIINSPLASVARRVYKSLGSTPVGIAEP
jgi:CelD/BcsL family acetyltransferase involved in cellulose biosynthesis